MANAEKPGPKNNALVGFIFVVALSVAGAWYMSSLPKVTPESERQLLAAVDRPTYAVAPPPARVLIWTSEAAYDRGWKMAEAGVSKQRPDMMNALLACSVASGTRIKVMNGGLLSSTVMVSEGQMVGCEGFLPNEFIKNAKP